MSNSSTSLSKKQNQRRIGQAIERYLHILVGIFLTVLMIFTLLVVNHWSTRSAYDQLSAQNKSDLIRFSSALTAILQRYDAVPNQLSIHPLIKRFLNEPNSEGDKQDVNEFFKVINDIHQSSDIYLMNIKGDTLAHSNWQSDKSFVGRNFAFRPYFQQAKQGELGRYYALGTTSNQRGYYFSAPVIEAGGVLGIVVLKISLNDIEDKWTRLWESSQTELIVTDPNNVVFVSTYAPWRLKSLGKLSDKQMLDLTNSKRYGGYVPPEITLNRNQEILLEGLERLQLITLGHNSKQTTYLVQSLDMPSAGWKVKALTDIKPVKSQNLYSLLIVMAGYVISLLIALYITERIRQGRRLHRAKEQLEVRVKQRTQELVSFNEKLRAEIDERSKTQVALKETQEELVHAAKMAMLGQISAGINHELNQPLAAIRTYTQNAQLLLKKERPLQVQENLDEIIELSDHMASIIGQLKVFSQKRPTKLESMDVKTSLDAAIRIMEPTLERQSIEIIVEAPKRNCLINGDIIRLEQVFINLFANAADAMKKQKRGKIFCSLDSLDDHVYLTVQDNGPGIDTTLKSKIFDPFYTSKDISQGLGLGLSITQRIVQSFNGDITVSDSPMGGAQFNITFPRFG